MSNAMLEFQDRLIIQIMRTDWFKSQTSMIYDYWKEELRDLAEDPEYTLMGYFEEGMDNWVMDQNDEQASVVLDDIKNYLSDNANWDEIVEYLLKSNKV
tara:strand:- start:1134 stop:1430 length:297 start_codon:yes stop_codon:yes gene_type:complete